MKAKPVGIEALVVAARAAGYAMAPAEDTDYDPRREFDVHESDADAAGALPQSRAIVIWTSQREAAQGVAQTVSTWVRDRLPARGWRVTA